MSVVTNLAILITIVLIAEEVFMVGLKTTTTAHHTVFTTKWRMTWVCMIRTAITPVRLLVLETLEMIMMNMMMLVELIVKSCELYAVSIGFLQFHDHIIGVDHTIRR